MSSVPTQLSSVEAESQRTQDRATERASRYVSPNPTVESVNERDGALLAAVANTEILAGEKTGKWEFDFIAKTHKLSAQS